MAVDLLHIGFGNYVPVARVVAVMSPDSAPVKRMVQQGRSGGRAVDMTKGRKTKAVLVMDSGHVVLAAIATETIAARMVADRVPRLLRRGRRQKDS
ncbi:MAG: DUF370 domain-containing protein [Dehalococcoidia bacterium]